jgi:opacity protein-like surface antigen
MRHDTNKYYKDTLFMKWITKIIATGLLAITSSAYAVNPQPDWYAGLLVGGNYIPNMHFTYVDPLAQVKPGTLGYDILGQFGGQIGYRWCDNYRFEGQFFYNSTSFSYLRLDTLTIHSQDESAGLRMNGATQSGVIAFNAFYDFFGDYSSNAVPYVGAGIGYAYISSKIKWFADDTQITVPQVEDYLGLDFSGPGIAGNGQSHSGIVGQLIAGISYYMDDFSYFALDARYLVSKEQTIMGRQTRRASNSFDLRYQLYSINLIFNGAFDCG